MDSLFNLSSVHRNRETELIVWPENAIDKPIQMDSWHAKRIADSARTWQTNFIIGTGLYTLYPEQTPELYRSSVNGVKYNTYNSTLFADSTGQLSRYDKAQLVPFVERFPFVEFLNKIDVFNWVDWGKHAGFGQGGEPSMLESSSGFISPKVPFASPASTASPASPCITCLSFAMWTRLQGQKLNSDQIKKAMLRQCLLIAEDNKQY